MNEITFTIDGPVQAQQRPRFSRQNGHVRTYDAKESRTYKAHVTRTASRYAPEQLIDSAIELHVVIYRPLTSDIKRSKIQTTKALSGERKPIKKPDIENLVKGIMDGCTGVLWVDDSLVTKLVAEKVFGEEERAEITIKY
ncbi:RusA family crossover junction endodeoxyribonuclease [Kurthia populi]|uniref:RusA family crossover junction endodeoxyribonuclease n=1 Tax=Kurthia populi TaxID=1562132 RepID=A0ABW5XX27_9BACL